MSIVVFYTFAARRSRQAQAFFRLCRVMVGAGISVLMLHGRVKCRKSTGKRAKDKKLPESGGIL
jgi:hypothetical protein